MKKLMFAVAVSACAIGALGDACVPEPVVLDVARVYQVQMNVCTTKGKAVFLSGVGSTQCAPGTDACLVMRGKDTTIFRGYLYVCADLCELSDYACIMADVRRKAIFEYCEFCWDLINVIGPNSTDAESVWAFSGCVSYDETREQEYDLRGAGYGVFKSEAGGMYFDDLSGNFAGMASASYDLTTQAVYSTGYEESCVCCPSQVLKCFSCDGVSFEDSDTLAFGTWKVKYNPQLSKEYLRSGELVLMNSIWNMLYGN